MGDNNSSTSTTNVDRLNSFHPECNDLKQQYDQCFNVWFTEQYMNGHYNNNKCQKIFEAYTECVKVLVYLLCINIDTFPYLFVHYALFSCSVV